MDKPFRLTTKALRSDALPRSSFLLRRVGSTLVLVTAVGNSAFGGFTGRIEDNSPAVLTVTNSTLLRIGECRRAGTGLHCRFIFLEEHRPAWVRFQAHKPDVAAPTGQLRQEELTLDQCLFQGSEGQVRFSQGGMEKEQVIRTCGGWDRALGQFALNLPRLAYLLEERQRLAQGG